MSMSPIACVTPHSPADKAGILVGEQVLRINDNLIMDVLDYKFYSYDESLSIQLSQECGSLKTVEIKKEEGQDLGLEFETYLMDKARSCANQCIFCFVDQMPQGMRETLYFKDDDARLSFLTGNYITLTNLSPRERQRIVDLKISPINISVHATNPKLRETMLKHPKAGDCMEIMKQFAQGGITMNCQIVACPTINDGDALEETLSDLSTLYPQVNSVSVVPIGITKYRENLPKLKSYTKETALKVIECVETMAESLWEKQGSRFVWCSDEFYLQGGKQLPEEEYYEDFTQLDNGVGMLRMFRCEFLRGLNLMEGEELKGEDFSIATGTAAAPLLQELVECAKNRSKEAGFEMNATVFPIQNDFFGHTVNVAGLVTGKDLIAQLQGKNLGRKLLIPESMLRFGEDVFLDDITLKQVEMLLKVPIIPIPQDGYDLVDGIYGQFVPKERSVSEWTVPLSAEAYFYNPS